MTNLDGRIDEIVLRHSPYGKHNYIGPPITNSKSLRVERKRTKSPPQDRNNPFKLPVVMSSHYNPGITDIT